MTKEGLLTPAHPEYPPQLKNIYGPPKTLYVRGNLQTSGRLLAVVGTRRHTSMGARIVETIIEPIAAEIGIVSGLATGIDSLAHTAALRAGGYTIAVLGTGIDAPDISQAQQKLLEKIIASGGAVISEYPPGTHATKFTFPARNRIIAGLSQATLVIEAGVKSGALITAACALEQGREVLAVPHQIFSAMGEGPNNLIRSGATVITSADDVRAIFKLQQKLNLPRPNPHSNATPLEKAVLELISAEPQTSDAIGRALAIPAPQMAVLLTEMEIKGMIVAISGQRYSISSL